VSRLESDQLVAAARARGARIEYLVFPGEGHGLARFQPRVRFFAAAEQFLAEYLGGILEPPAPDEDWRPHRR
jgi:dipeptidyl aminopeptidase/acylaminoacyl peptidase